MLLHQAARNWWVLLLQGIVAILFGILALAWPGLTILALVAIFGAYALVDGIAAIAVAFAGRREHGVWWEMLLLGLVSVLAGVLTFLWPGITAVVLLVLIAAWAIVRGIFEIVAAVKLRKVIEHEWLLGAAGVLSILFGIILIARPLVGALAVVWMISVYALLFGVLAILLSLRLRRLRPATDEPMSGMPVGVS